MQRESTGNFRIVPSPTCRGPAPIPSFSHGRPTPGRALGCRREHGPLATPNRSRHSTALASRAAMPPRRIPDPRRPPRRIPRHRSVREAISDSANRVRARALRVTTGPRLPRVAMAGGRVSGPRVLRIPHLGSLTVHRRAGRPPAVRPRLHTAHHARRPAPALPRERPRRRRALTLRAVPATPVVVAKAAVERVWS